MEKKVVNLINLKPFKGIFYIFLGADFNNILPIYFRLNKYIFSLETFIYKPLDLIPYCNFC